MRFQANILLYPFSFLVKLAYQTRRYLYENNSFASSYFHVPVISVGNIEMGGTGKTPMTAFIANHLEQQGKKVAIVTRGYKGKKKDVCLERSNLDQYKPEEVGDEPFMLSKFMTSSPILVGKNRVKNIIKHIFLHQHATFILEDGFQHLKVQRSIDVVLINGGKDLSTQNPFPAGLLREGKTSLSRADIIVLTKCHGEKPTELEQKNIAEIKKYVLKDTPILRSGIKFQDLYDLKKEETLPLGEIPQSVVTLCGIGDPKGFKLTLEKIGLKVEKIQEFKNHYSFNESSYKKINKMAKGRPIVCTLKDAVKINPEKIKSKIFAINTEVDFFGHEKEFINFISQRI